MITRQQALARAAGQLAAHPALAPTALADAVQLLLHLLGIGRTALIAHPETPMNREQMAGYQRLLERRLRFEPMQYITGEQEFYGLALRVTPAVLIPRPETETLVEAVAARLPRQPALRVADVGTGSGAIAIALAHLLNNVWITAIDLSADALAVARDNAHRHGVADRIEFVASDLLAAVSGSQAFDAIVSNPPYVAETDAASLHPQVREFEPAQALFAGSDGLDCYRRLIPQAHRMLTPGGLLALEIGAGQQEAIAGLLAGWQDVEFLPDLQGIARVALARCG